MTKLPHTHESGCHCLACDVETAREEVYQPLRDRQWDALDRIEAALAEREHLEEGAAYLLHGYERAKRDHLQPPGKWSWYKAERARKGEKG